MRYLLIAGGVGAAGSVAAYCDSSPSVAEELTTAPLVFVARVRSADEPSNATGTFYTVDVRQRLKGASPATLQLYSENSSGRFPMQVGRDYVLFVSQQQFEHQGHRWFVDNCGNSAPLPEAKKVLATVKRLTKA